MGEAMDGFMLFAEYIGPVGEMSDEEAGRLFKAILAYVNGMEAPELGAKEGMAFAFIRNQLDRTRESYERRCAINRANGMKGGRPKKGGKGRGKEKDEDGAAKEKEKEKPEKLSYAEFVTMTEAEHSRLVDRYGEEATARMIEILDNYKGLSKSNQKRYDSDYRAILSWVVERYEEEAERKSRSRPQQRQKDTDDDWQSFYERGYE